MNKAVFIDRDGVINNDKGQYYIYKPENFYVNSGAFDFLLRCQQDGYLLIIISNQGGISKGIYKTKDVDKVHKKLINLAKNKGITFSEIYYCPHHPSIENCLCRKPSPLLIEKALSRFSIDPSISYFIGDRESDMKTAMNARLKGIRIYANDNLMNYLDQIELAH
jgi:D-glycero-D-manno-heptose 1,7-bisphosphate phosphatase